MNAPNRIRLIGSLLAAMIIIVAACNQYGNNLVLFDFLLLAAMLLLSIGLILRLEQARRLMVGTAAVAFLYGVIVLIVSHGARPVGVHMVILGAVAWINLRQQSIRDAFQGRPAREQKAVLLIEDDKGFARALKAHLVPFGIVLHHAETGEKGIRLAKRIRPDLILLDVILPGIKGREVCLRLKEDPRVKDVPVVFLTAKDSEDDILAEMDAGGVSHVTKPIDAKTLYAHIQHFL